MIRLRNKPASCRSRRVKTARKWRYVNREWLSFMERVIIADIVAVSGPLLRNNMNPFHQPHDLEELK